MNPLGYISSWIQLQKVSELHPFEGYEGHLVPLYNGSNTIKPKKKTGPTPRATPPAVWSVT